MQLVRRSKSGAGARQPAQGDKLVTAELVALFQAGQYAAVEQRARELLVRHPQSGFLWKALGAALQIQDKDALHALRQASIILSEDAEAHSNLAGALRVAGQAALALKSTQRALRLNPGLADAHCNHGTALLDLKRTDDAITSLNRAVKINPGHALAWNNLGNALQAKWRFAESVDCYRRAIALAPHYAEAHNNLGKALRDLLQMDEALQCYRRALELKPDYLEAQCNLAVVMQECGQFRAAVATLRRVLELRPDYAEAHFNLACVLRHMGPSEAAEAHCAAALEINPELLGARILRGEFHADRGEFELAEQEFRSVIAIDPKEGGAWGAIARVRKMEPADGNWFASTKALVSQALPLREEAGLRYALGKYCDDLGNHAEAFEHYRRANNLDKAAGPAYRAELEHQAVDRIIGRCDAPWVRRRRPGATDSACPVFVIGMPRSGTSLTEQILASHPAVHGAGELPYWESLTPELVLQLEAFDDAPWQAVAQDYLAILNKAAPAASRVVDKMPANYRRLGLIHAALPQARFIHMQRNPADTCLSIYFQRFNVTHTYAHDLHDLVHHYRLYRRLMAHWHAVLPPGAILDVPYEELVQDQEGWSRRMLEFIGLPWDDACLRFHENKRTVNTLSNWQVRQKMNTTSVERWRRYEAEVRPLLQLL